jgi:hypothetical protein
MDYDQIVEEYQLRRITYAADNLLPSDHRRRTRYTAPLNVQLSGSTSSDLENVAGSTGTSATARRRAAWRTRSTSISPRT